MAATVLLTCAGFLAISVVFGFIGAKLSDEPPPRRRSSHNSLAAYSLGGSVKPAGRNMKSWLAVLQ